MGKRGIGAAYLVMNLAFVVAGCTTGVMTPELRKSEDDGQGRFIYGCRNVSPDAVVDQYITDSYLSTWRSAWLEGLREGFKEPGYNLFPLSYAKRSVTGKMPEPYVFCRAFDYPFAEVAKTVATVFPRLQIPIEISNVSDGIFQTQYAFRRHDSEKLGLLGSPARWKVRYQVGVHPNPVGGADVLIFRELYIARFVASDKTKKTFVNETKDYGLITVQRKYWKPDYSDENSWSDYITAYSDGGNEGWLMTQIDRELKQ